MKLPSLVAFKIKNGGWEGVWICLLCFFVVTKGWVAYTNSLTVFWVPPIVRRCGVTQL